VEAIRRDAEGVAHVVALSGGKDSTALALRLREVSSELPTTYLCTPTGDELPEMLAHWERLETLLGTPLTRITNGTLKGWIRHYGSLPNWRQRWCTRLLKIEPCLAFLKEHEPCILYVGLRADEEERQGIYSNDVVCRFPLREWGWGLEDVRGYLRERCVRIPRRTDCARCYGQRLEEWRDLWQRHPDLYADAERDEAETGHTFRSPGRDSRPAPLAELKMTFQPVMLDLDDDADEQHGACRVCRL
jgi:hypothetical protein